MTDPKSALRREALALRAGLIPTPEDEAALAENVLSLIEAFEPGILAGYWPTRNEISSLAVFEAARDKGWRFCLPVTSEDREDRRMRFYPWSTEDALKAGNFGIAEPLARDGEVMPDCILVPLLAFDRTGQRLGYGGGYYDATIRRLREQGSPAYTIGLAYDQQICLFSLPKEEHDVPLDAICTPTRPYVFTPITR